MRKLLLACAAVLAPMASHAYVVDVGYADGLRSGPFFPIPWTGDANTVTFNPGAFISDNGAVGIDNRAGSSAVVIDMSTFSYRINYSSIYTVGTGTFTVAAGEFGIVLLDDTSDLSYISGATYGNLASGCTGSGTNPNPADTCPTVTFNDGSGAATYLDSGHVLDTGGFDFAANGSNESFQWRPIGTVGGQAGDIPEPATLAVLGAGIIGLFGARARRR